MKFLIFYIVGTKLFICSQSKVNEKSLRYVSTYKIYHKQNKPGLRNFQLKYILLFYIELCIYSPVSELMVFLRFVLFCFCFCDQQGNDFNTIKTDTKEKPCSDTAKSIMHKVSTSPITTPYLTFSYFVNYYFKCKGKIKKSLNIPHLVLTWDNIFGTTKSANWDKKKETKRVIFYIFAKSRSRPGKVKSIHQYKPQEANSYSITTSMCCKLQLIRFFGLTIKAAQLAIILAPQ